MFRKLLQWHPRWWQTWAPERPPCVMFAVSGFLTEERGQLETLCVDLMEEGAW